MEAIQMDESLAERWRNAIAELDGKLSEADSALEALLELQQLYAALLQNLAIELEATPLHEKLAGVVDVPLLALAATLAVLRSSVSDETAEVELPLTY
jgi:hypothetical protein